VSPACKEPFQRKFLGDCGMGEELRATEPTYIRPTYGTIAHTSTVRSLARATC
jgi:hypothetical protein